jgi:uncharacterized oxidoreductase
MQLTDNTILITNGTSGIGRALAGAFHQLGNQVIIAGARQILLDEITAAHPGMHGVLLDLDERCTIDKFATRMQKQFPKLNVLINHFGMANSEVGASVDARKSSSELVSELSAAWSTINGNITRTLHLTAALLPPLKRQAHSTIITTSADLASIPLAAFPTYCAGKEFLHTRLRALLRQTGVEIRELAPAYVRTEFTNAASTADLAKLNDFIVEVMQILNAPQSAGSEIRVKRDETLHEEPRATADGSGPTLSDAISA